MEKTGIVEQIHGKNYSLYLGDSCQVLRNFPDNSIDMMIFSPPFADLYTYTNSEHDLGNSKDWEQFFAHYSFIIQETLRIIKPGRLTCVHTADIPAMAVKDGYIGMKDFPGEVIRAYEKSGWIFVGRAIVGKNPQAQAIRTKAKALLFVQVNKDSSHSRPAILDQVLLFKKPGENAIPITPAKNGELDNEKWIDWASGVWLDIHESDTLKYAQARDQDDEKHIAPLQLGTIERCIKLYSNPREIILTPFLGIGSEAYQAIKFGRKAIGIELKESYFRIAAKNLAEVTSQVAMPDLFSAIGHTETIGEMEKSKELRTEEVEFPMELKMEEIITEAIATAEEKEPSAPKRKNSGLDGIEKACPSCGKMTMFNSANQWKCPFCGYDIMG